jgi:hypothetical protein
MASRTALVRAVEIVHGDDSAFPGETLTNCKCAIVYIENGTSSTVAGGTDTLDCDLGAAIQGKVRNGKTVTIRSADVAVGPAYVGGTAYGATSSMSSNTVSITPKSAADWTTNATLPANTSKTDRCFRVACWYSEA